MSGEVHEPRAQPVSGNEIQELVALFNAGRYAQLEANARSLTTRNPTSGIAWKVLGASLGVQGKDALAALQRAAQLLPQDAESHNNLGNALRDCGQLDAAVASCRRALQLKPDFAEAHNNLGSALLGLNQLDEAVASCRRALQLKPDFAEAHNNLGNALLELDRVDEAVASYRQALQLKPQYAEAHSNLSNALLELDRVDEAVASCRRALQLKPQYPEAHNNLGHALIELGQLEEAVASYRQALQLKPDFAEAHNNLGHALIELGQLEEAVNAYGRALELKPDFAEAHNGLGGALLRLGRVDEAVASCRRALEIDPDCAEVHNNWGCALFELGQVDEAVASYRQALQLKPQYAEAHNNLAIALERLGRLEEAEASCRCALDIKPDAAVAMAVLANLRADQGQFAEAEALYQRAISIEPNLPEAWAGIAQLRKMTANDVAWLAEAQRLAGQRLPARKEAQLRYAIGKYFNDVQDFEQAFAQYRRANEVSKSITPKYDRPRVTQAMDRIIQSHDPEWLNRTRIQTNTSARPVFIVGMPRSGTTLAEQILASHPHVFGAGEVTFWRRAAAAYQAAVHDGSTSADVLEALANDYLQLLTQLSTDALRIVDKMPSNFQHLGLIHAALPEARIIHMRRNPVDTCLSVYFQYFSIARSYANDLQDLAHFYGQYQRVMQHWRSTLPAQSMLEVPYEGLVEDQEGWSRTMLEFVGLPWDPRCLDFHQTSRTVLTASNWQVRQKINRSSVARWRNYQPFIGPLMHLMESTSGG